MQYESIHAKVRFNLQHLNEQRLFLFAHSFTFTIFRTASSHTGAYVEQQFRALVAAGTCLQVTHNSFLEVQVDVDIHDGGDQS